MWGPRSVCRRVGRNPVVGAALSFPFSFPSASWREEVPGEHGPSSAAALAASGFPSAPLLSPSPLPPLPSRQPTCCDLWEGLTQGSETGKFPVYTRIP